MAKKIITPTLDAKLVFQAGLQFEVASVVISQLMARALQAGRSPEIAIVSLQVNTAFAAEMYFKSLSLVLAVPTVQTHNLRELYDDLPQKTKDSLDNRFIALSQSPSLKAIANKKLELGWKPTTFAQEVDQAAKVFEQWRYWFQGPTQSAIGPSLPIVLRKEILANKPEWEQVEGQYLPPEWKFP